MFRAVTPRVYAQCKVLKQTYVTELLMLTTLSLQPMNAVHLTQLIHKSYSLDNETEKQVLDK